jgi:hypothetical protein
MSELMRRLRPRVDEIIQPHRDMYGDDAPVVRMALLVLAEAECIAAELDTRKVGTDEAADLTGWHSETLQAKARAALGVGGVLQTRWRGLQVEQTPAGYLFVLSSIPEHPSRRRRAN